MGNVLQRELTMKRRKVILLYGCPAVGKLTIAKRLKLSQNDCRIYDNHMFNDWFFGQVDVDNPKKLVKMCAEVYKLRNRFLKFLYTNNNYNEDTWIIFTNVLLNNKEDRNSVEHLKKFAKKIDADFVPIQLEIDRNILIGRVSNKDRKSKKKLTDKTQLKSFLSNFEFMTIKHPNHICIENTDIKNTLNTIRKHVNRASEVL
jgi:hypothetical protein